MKSNFIKKNRLMFLFIILIILALLSSHYTPGDAYKNFRVKRMEETQKYSSYNGRIKSDHTVIYSKEFAAVQELNENISKKLLAISNELLTLFLLLTIILSFCQLYQYIRRRNILMSQTKNKLFMVHYLQLKDGKKNALSFG
ncbi:MAG: hypothetical protein PHF63_07870, partial [Herbinix sp.]|nr:hypothetical protein [Herbinix sp.]